MTKISPIIIQRLGNLYPNSASWIDDTSRLPSDLLFSSSLSGPHQNLLNPDSNTYDEHYRFIAQVIYNNKSPRALGELYLDSLELVKRKGLPTGNTKNHFEKIVQHLSGSASKDAQQKLLWLRRGIEACVESCGDINSLLESYTSLFDHFASKRNYDKQKKHYDKAISQLPKDPNAIEYLNAHYSIYGSTPSSFLEDSKTMFGMSALNGYRYLIRLNNGGKLNLPYSFLKKYVEYTQEMVSEDYSSAAIHSFSLGALKILKTENQNKEQSLTHYYPRCKNLINICSERNIPLDYLREIFSNTEAKKDVHLVLDPIERLINNGIKSTDATRNINRQFVNKQNRKTTEEIKQSLESLVDIFILANSCGVDLNCAADLFSNSNHAGESYVKNVEESIKEIKSLIEIVGSSISSKLIESIKKTLSQSQETHRQNLKDLRELLSLCRDSGITDKNILESILDINNSAVSLSCVKLIIDFYLPGKCSISVVNKILNKAKNSSQYSKFPLEFNLSSRELLDYVCEAGISEADYIDKFDHNNPSFWVSFDKIQKKLNSEGYTDEKYKVLVDKKLGQSKTTYIQGKKKRETWNVLSRDQIDFYETNLFKNLKFYNENKARFENVDFGFEKVIFDNLNKISSSLSSETFQALCVKCDFNSEIMKGLITLSEGNLKPLDLVENAPFFERIFERLPEFLGDRESLGKKVEILKNVKPSENFDLMLELINELRKGYSFHYFQFIMKNSYYPAQIETIRNAPLEKREKVIKEVAIHTAISILTRSSDPEKRAEARSFISSNTSVDHVPYPQQISEGVVHPEGKRVFNEALSTYKRGFDIYHGYSSLSYDARRTRFDKVPLLYRFGSEVADHCKFIKVEGNEIYPGRSLFISGINLENVFAKDSKAEEKNLDPFHDHISALPWLSQDFADLPLTDFILGRGFIAVTCNNGEKYKLEDNNYSYVIFNDHFGNNDANSVVLVPSKIIYDAIKGTLHDPGLKPDDSTKTLITTALTFSELKSKCREMKANLLNIGWGSNIGGLCNAYPPKSSPYHLWETRLASYHTKDSYGHVHKSHISGVYASLMTPHIDSLLEPLRKAHTNVYKITRSYQNLFDMFRLSLSMYHKGFTIGETPVFNYEEEIPEEINEELPEEIDEIEFGEGLDVMQDSTLRMYAECYKWNQSGNEQNIEDRNYYPVLAIANVLSYSSKPDISIYLDTYDMSLHAGENVFDLSRPFLAKSRNTWFKEVMEKVLETSKDLRLYDRRDLGIL